MILFWRHCVHIKKPKGYFKYILAFDLETTGLVRGEHPCRDYKTDECYQIVSGGFIVADSHTLKPIEKLYVEIKWNRESIWAKGAERVHGLSVEYLDENGLTEEEAVLEIGKFILKYFGPKDYVNVLGHNIGTFDVPFLRDLFGRFDVPLNISHRFADTNAIGFCALETYTSDELFEVLGFEKRSEHNALDDAEYALRAARVIRNIFNKAIG